MNKIFNIVEKNEIAEVTISGTIGMPSWYDGTKNSTKEELTKEIESLKNINADTILLKIDSLGGSVIHAAAMVNALKNTNKKIEVEYVGYTASAGTHFATIAEKVSIPENIFLLIHEGTLYQDGTAEELEAGAKVLKDINTQLAHAYAEQSKRAGKNKDANFFENLMKEAKGKGKWLTSSELLEIGLVTDVKPIFNAVNLASKEILNKYHLPEIPDKFSNNKKSSKKMDLFNFFKNNKPNLLELAEGKAIYNGKLKEGSELVGVNGFEIKDGTYEVDGYTLNIENSKVIKFSEISEQKEAVNIADFKNEFETLKNENSALKNSIQETAKEQNEVIENLVNSVKELTEKLEALQNEGSEIDLPKKELKGNTTAPFNAKEESRKRIAASKEKK